VHQRCVNASGDGALAYLDSSELVKLIALEPETAALRAELARWPQWVIFIWIALTALVDLFRRHDVSGWAKATWVVFIVILPWIGVLVI
jgi:hypothetical protein